MKVTLRILTALLANLALAIIGLLGGALTGSMAVMSESLHSLGDSATLMIAYLLEKKSKQGPDKKHTFGYSRYSMLGGLITDIFMIVGAFVLIIETAGHLHGHDHLHTSGMIILALLGIIANLLAMLITNRKENANERAVSLHALQDVLSWSGIVASAVIAEIFEFHEIDTIISILIAGYIIVRSFIDLKKNLYVFLDNTPPNVNYEWLLDDLTRHRGVKDVHHLHVWSLDGNTNCASVHVVCTKTDIDKKPLHAIFAKHKIDHATIEIEDSKDCEHKDCNLK